MNRVTKEKIEELRDDCFVIIAHNCPPDSKYYSKYLCKFLEKRDYCSDIYIVTGSELKKFYKNSESIASSDLYIILNYLATECDTDFGFDIDELASDTGLELNYLDSIIEDIE